MEKVLIIGGAGFIGNEIVEKLNLLKKYEVRVLDNFSVKIHGENYRESYLFKGIEGKCELIIGDVLNKNDVLNSLKDVDYIIHLVSETGTGESMYDICKYTETNITGLANVFDVIINNKINIKKIILSSSRSIYGEGTYKCFEHGELVPENRNISDMIKGDFNNKCPTCKKELKLLSTSEKSELKPISYYAYTKYSQEMMIKTMCSILNIEFTIFRYQNVYGVGQSLTNPYTGILSIFSKLMLKNKKINIFEDGKESRDFINIKDVALITCNAIYNIKTNSEIINVGSGYNTSVFKVANLLKKYYKSKSEIIITGDFRKGDIRHNKADITKAFNICDFTPKVAFEEGLRSFTQWVINQKNNGSNNNNYDYYHSIKQMENKGMLVKTKVI